MIDVAALPPNYLGNVFLVFIRVGAMIFSAPLLSSKAIPVMVKVGLTILLSVLLVPINQGHFTAVPFEWLPLSELILKEMAVGVLVGFVVNLVFTAMQLAGQFVGMQIGISLANVLDPVFSQSVTILDQFYTIVAGLIFLAIDGHHMLILAVQQTLELVPIGTFQLTQPMFNDLAQLTGGLFSAAVRIVLPIMATLLLTDIALGLMSRTMPQMNIFIVGLPLKMFVGFLVLVVTLPAVGDLATALFRSSFVDLSNLLRMTTA